MKTRFVVVLSLSLGLLSAGAARADSPVLGAVVGGGLGAVVGNQIGGRDGAIVGGAVGAAAGHQFKGKAVALAEAVHRRWRHRKQRGIANRPQLFGGA